MEIKEAIKKETKEEQRKLTLEERRLVEIRKEIKNNDLLDEYVTLYLGITINYASTLRINFDNLRE
tara:strand:- start:513 stop:710 length:198 start_codon:yes stop_codon:yes gene_type:complete